MTEMIKIAGFPGEFDLSKASPDARRAYRTAEASGDKAALAKAADAVLAELAPTRAIEAAMSRPGRIDAAGMTPHSKVKKLAAVDTTRRPLAK